MGTRGYIAITKGNQFLGMYNHFDSYPSFLGANMIELMTHLMRSKEDADKLFNLEVVKAQDKPDESTLQKMKDGGFWSNVSSGDDWYSALRECQGEVLKYIEAGYIIADTSPEGCFMEDSLFCEYAYVLNLDTGILDFYEGFQKEVATKGLFAGKDTGNDYQTCNLVSSYDLNENYNADIIVEHMDFITTDKEDYVSYMQDSLDNSDDEDERASIFEKADRLGIELEVSI